MQEYTYIVRLFVIYSGQDKVHFTRMQQIIASVRQMLIAEKISLILSRSVCAEQIAEWQYSAESNLKKADIVLLLVSQGLLSVDIALLQKTLASRTTPDVLLAAAAPHYFNWQQTDFYQWCSRYFGVYLLEDLAQAGTSDTTLFEHSLADLVQLAAGLQEEKIYRLYLQEGNKLLKQKKWIEAGKKFSNALSLGQQNAEEDLQPLYEKLQICHHELQFDQLVRLGKLAYQQENYSKACHYFERALQLKPDPEVVLLRENSLRTPVPGYKLLKQLSEEAWFYECLQEAERLFKLQKWEAAHEQFEQAAAMHHFEFGYNLSNIYRRMKECRTARCFNEVFNLGREAYKAKNHHEALAFFEEACALNPNDPTANRVRNKCRRIVFLKNLLPYALKLLILLLIGGLLLLIKYLL
ncbi:tetratricopeptide repeat protein [Sphingobacteriales bacterium UPWRP_1]|nr:hypothetical protein B6N25_07040 [Sphingobacteriales bacterium TSM_CSS]PSJ74833.1 tetratricopeptide repeat protein [Sphingobacteriales bacterium UPWRP_1]